MTDTQRAIIRAHDGSDNFVGISTNAIREALDVSVANGNTDAAKRLQEEIDWRRNAPYLKPGKVWKKRPNHPVQSDLDTARVCIYNTEHHPDNGELLVWGERADYQDTGVECYGYAHLFLAVWEPDVTVTLDWSQDAPPLVLQLRAKQAKIRDLDSANGA